MSLEQGVVASVTDNGWAQVVTERKDACSDCGAAHCCQSLSSEPKMVTRALNRAGAKVGDLVSVSLKTQTVIKSAMIVYVIPVAGLIAGALAGAPLSKRWAIDATTGSMLLAFMGLFLGFVAIAVISRWMSARSEFTPVITGIIRTGLLSPSSSMAVDPVCKMIVAPAEAPASFTHEDRTYYFCSPLCRNAFIRDPEKFLREDTLPRLP
jgi:positive regulator of sigma E activity/YHS domain-containing protein